MDEVNVKLSASFQDGDLIISRQDGQPISLITYDEYCGDPVEVLEYGSSGNAVKALQALLNCHGQHLDVDGSFGPATQTALIIFSDEKSLPADGVCTGLHWQALIAR